MADTQLVREPEVLREADLVCEALVREIAHAGRWSAVIEAWQALLAVRRISRTMAEEQAILSGQAQSPGRSCEAING